MKKILLFSLLLSTSSILTAQIVPGGIYGGLSGNYRYMQYNAKGFRPELTMGVSEHSTMGIFFENNKFTGVLGDNGIRNNRLDVTSGVTFNYLHPFGKSKRWGWMINSSLSFTHSKFYEKSMTTQTLVNSINEYRLSFSPGIYYKASKNLTVFARFGEFGINRQTGGYPIMFRGYHEFRLGILWNFGSILKKKSR